MTRRGFAGAAVSTTVVGGMTATVPAAGGTFTIASATGWVFTATPFVVVIDRGALTEEKILCSAISGTTLTVGQRGYDGTAGEIHEPGASILHVLDSITVDDLNAGRFYSATTGTVPIVVRGFSGQVGDLQQWQNSATTIKAKVDADGQLYAASCFIALNAPTYMNARMSVIPATTNEVGCLVRGMAGQTGDLQQWQASDAAVMLRFKASGSLVFPYSASTPAAGPSLQWSDGTYAQTFGLHVMSGLFFQGNAANPDFGVRTITTDGTLGGLAVRMTNTGKIHFGTTASNWINQHASSTQWLELGDHVTIPGGVLGVGTTPNGSYRGSFWAGSAGTIPLLAKGAASQTADLQQWQNDAGVSQFKVAADGALVGRSGIRRKTITTPYQGNTDNVYELARISRDSANWDAHVAFEVTVHTKSYGGGSRTRALVNYGYSSPGDGTISIVEAFGTQPLKVYLGAEVVVSGNIKYRPVLIDIPPYIEADVEVIHNYAEVGAITAVSQVHFTGTMTVTTARSYQPGITLLSSLSTTTSLSASTFVQGAGVGSGVAFKVGDDAEIWDVSVADTLNIRGTQTPANGRVTFGSAGDTNLYRSAADTLKTDDAFVVAGALSSLTSISAPSFAGPLSGAWVTVDDRTISPSEIDAGTARFGFTSWTNNNSSPWADYFHLRSYADGSGGNDNLVMFRKDAIGMRIWQQTFGSATAYGTYKDVALEGNSVSFGQIIASGRVYSSSFGDGGSPQLSTNNNRAAVMVQNSEVHLRTNTVDNTPVTRLFVDGSGNVGIGTTTPSEKLEIVGQGQGIRLFPDFSAENESATTLNTISFWKHVDAGPMESIRLYNKATFATHSYQASDLRLALTPVGGGTPVDRIVFTAVGNLQQWLDTSSTLATYITADGSLRVGANNSTAAFGSVAPVSTQTVSVRAGVASHVPLVVAGNASQSANLQQWQGSTGTVLSRVEAGGEMVAYALIAGQTSWSWLTASLAAVPINNSVMGIVARGVAGQIADLQQWQDSDSVVQARVSAGGVANFGRLGVSVGIYNPGNDNAVMRVDASNTTQTPILVRGYAAQSGDLQRWEDSAGAVLASITSGGSFTAANFAGPATSVTSETTFGMAPAVGTSVFLARADHTHGSPDQSADLETWLWMAVSP